MLKVPVNYIYVLAASLLAIIFYKQFIENYAIVLLLGLFFVGSCLTKKSFYVTNRSYLLLFILLLNIFLIFCFFIVDEKQPFYESIDHFFEESFIGGSLIVLVAFLTGYCYGNLNANALVKTNYVLAAQLSAFIIYTLINHGINIEYNLLQGTMVVVYMPYIILLFQKKSVNYVYLLCLLIAIYLLIISSRACALSVFVFMSIYFIYPWIKRSFFRFTLIFLFCLFFFLILIVLYCFNVLDALNDMSLSLTGKSIDSGRNIIWPELISLIFDNPILGHGIMHSSSHQVSHFADWRNLSSHNTYLELLYRGGALLLGWCILMFITIWNCFRCDDELDMWGRIASSSMVSILFLSCSMEFLFTQNLMLNFMIWFFWGCAAGRVKKINLASTNLSISGINITKAFL
jgi:O-antigen ligase